MTGQTELATIRRALGDVQRSTTALHGVLGTNRNLRRLEFDVQRLREDVEDLAAAMPAQPERELPPVELVTVPDHAYEPGVFEGAEDEGLGATWGPPVNPPAPTRRRRGLSRGAR